MSKFKVSISNKIRNFQFLDASRFFLCLFFIFFPFQIRTLIYGGQVFLSGNFNIYTSFFLYASDIFLLSAFTFWILDFWKNERKTFIHFGEQKFTFLLVAFLFAMLGSVAFAADKWLHLLQVFRFMEFFVLYLLIVNNVIKTKTIVIILILGMAFQSLTAIFQYLLQSSLGLQFFGEPIVTAQTLGVGKIDLNAQKIVRAFGTFPHANVLGGALFMALVLNFAHFRRHAWIYWPFVILIGSAFLLTFSRSAFAALALVFLVYISFDNHKISLRSVLFVITLALFFIVVFHLEDIIFRLLFFENINGGLIPALQERGLYLMSSKDMLLHYPFGVGLGGFTQNMQQFIATKLMPWQYQPVHNIFLLSANELGVVGGGIFLFLFGYLFYCFTVKRRQLESGIQRHYCAAMLSLLAGITLIGFFDHYFFSLYPGQVLLFVYFALASDFLT